MARNIVLLLATLAILGVLFAAYVLVIREPFELGRPGTGETTLPIPVPQSAPTLRIADAVEVPPGQGVQFTVYEERTGRPSQRFSCREWTPIAGTSNQVAVSQPQMTLWLSGGLAVTIEAEGGELTVDGLERGAGRPRRGHLYGQVQVVAERRVAQTEPAQPTDIAVRVRLDDLDFDLERGELKTDGPVELVSESFQLSGTGLSVVWNQADNVLESLELARGERLMLTAPAGLAAGRPPEPAASMPGTPASARSRRPDTAKSGKTDSYVCVLSGGIRAEQFVGEKAVGALAADEIRILFDLRRDADLMARPEPDDRMPASQPTGELEHERLVLRWDGPLRVRPAPAGRRERPRRQLEATGQEVVLTRGEAQVRCQRLQYCDETGQIWLYAASGGRVEFGLGSDMSAVADSVYVDRTAGVVKLLGPVELKAGAARASASSADRGKLRGLYCELWARLHLRPQADVDVTAGLPAAGALEAASFVGNARVDLGDQTLTADRVEVRFAPQPQAVGDEPVLESVVATGAVRLQRGRESLRCARLELGFAQGPQGQQYPRRLVAAGPAVLSRNRSWLRGDRVEAELEPLAAEAAASDQEFAVRRLDVRGRAELRDWRNPRRQIAARGEHIEGGFSGISQLETALVTAASGQKAMIHVTPYTVVSSRIALEREGQTLRADGPAKLSFETTRGLSGQRRSRATPIVVTCDGPLQVDGRQNLVTFQDGVVAESGQEQLTADRLSLLLEDVEKPAATSRPALGDLLGPLSRLFERQPAGQRGGLELVGPELSGVRKEPAYLTAENALVLSEQREPGSDIPAVHFSIAAPRLEADLANRQIVSRGRTTLLVINRRPAEAAAGEPEVLGPGSALLARGPSQTAMRCDGSMTYALGEEPGSAAGPRRDSVLFEGDVVLRHRAGQVLGKLELSAEPPREAQDLRDTWLQCDRLECVLLVNEDEAPGQPARATRSIRIAGLIASGRAELRDQHGQKIRSVFAPQFDFDRENAVLRVLASAQSLARIYEEDRSSGEVRTLVGEQFVIDLERGTIRSGPARGELTAP